MLKRSHGHGEPVCERSEKEGERNRRESKKKRDEEKREPASLPLVLSLFFFALFRPSLLFMTTTCLRLRDSSAREVG